MDRTIKVWVRILGDLTEEFGDKVHFELEDGSKLKDLISKFKRARYPQRGFLGRYRITGSNLVMLINGRNINVLSKLETPLNDGDIVTLLPLSTGG